MPRPIESAPPQKAIDAVQAAQHAVELPDFVLPEIPEHPAPQGGLELLPAEVPEHPAAQAEEHLPSLATPELPPVELPEPAVAEIDQPSTHLPDFIFDLA